MQGLQLETEAKGGTLRATPVSTCAHTRWPEAVRQGAAVIAAWALFFYSWAEVLHQTLPDTMLQVGAEVALALVAIVVGAFWWILHNVAIGRRDRRWHCAAYQPARPRQDYFGREIVMLSPDAIAGASDISLAADGGRKYYAVRPRPRQS